MKVILKAFDRENFNPFNILTKVEFTISGPIEKPELLELAWLT